MSRSSSKYITFTFHFFSSITITEQCKFVEGHKRRDCGHYGISRDKCLDKGCCWSPIRGKNRGKHPWCHHSEGDKLFYL